MPNSSKLFRAITSFGCALLFVSSSWSQNADVSYRTVALTGEKAPDTDTNVNYLDVNDEPWLTEGTLEVPGRGVIRSSITGPGVVPGSNSVGLWEGPIGNLTLLARTGATPPGTASPIAFDNFDDQYRNSSGGPVAFGASLRGTSSDLDSGIWYRPNPSTASSLLVREGDTVPGIIPAATYLDLKPQVVGTALLPGYDIADVSGIVFIQAIASGNIPVVLAGIPGNVTNIAYQGGHAPGVPSEVSYAFCPSLERLVSPNPDRQPLLVRQFNQSGQLVFRGQLTGQGVSDKDNTGIWSGLRTSVSLFARENGQAADAAGGGLSGITYGDFPNDPELAPLITQDGRITFIGSLTGTGVGDDNKYAIWAGQVGSTPALVVRSGTVAPDTTDANYNRFLEAAVGNGTWLLFKTLLAGSGVTAGNDEAIYSGQGATFSLVAREGFAAPGTNNAVFKSFTRVKINGSGFVAFTARLTGTAVTENNDEGLWVGRPGSIKLIAREGSEVPDTVPGTTYAKNFFDPFLLNEANEVVFSGNTANATSGPSTGIWAYNLSGKVVLVAVQKAGVPKGSSFGEIQNPLSEARVLLDNNGGIEFPVTFNKTGAPDDKAVIVAKLRREPVPTVVVPAFSPVGGTYSTAVTVSLSTTTTEAAIHYTTDGSTPTINSPKFIDPFNVPASTVVKAIAFKDGLNASPIATAAYVIDTTSPKAATPTISPDGGTFSTNPTVTLATATTSASILYTIDGSDPKVNGQKYDAPFTLKASATVKAYATAVNFVDSDAKSATFIVNSLGDFAPAKLVVKPKFTATKSRFTVSGSAASKDGISRVEYRINGKSPALKAQGTGAWKINLTLKPGVTRLEIIAYTKFNFPSPAKNVTVTYKR